MNVFFALKGSKLFYSYLNIHVILTEKNELNVSKSFNFFTILIYQTSAKILKNTISNLVIQMYINELTRPQSLYSNGFLHVYHHFIIKV